MKVLLGRAEEAEADLTNAIRLSPRGPGPDRWHALLGVADLFLCRLESALDQLRKSVEINLNVAMPHFFLAAASALSGRAAEAREARKADLRLDPNFTVARFRNERRSQNPTFLAQRERIYYGPKLGRRARGASSVWFVQAIAALVSSFVCSRSLASFCRSAHQFRSSP
jgi:tetratricopeptide (TPR) repeat protein